MPSHKKLLLKVIAAIDSSENVDLTGSRMSGRTTLGQGISHHFRSLKRDVVVVSGKPMLTGSPLAAAGMAGFREQTVLGLAEAIGRRFGKGRGVAVVDDWDYVDPETWAALLHAHETYDIPLVAIRGIDRRAPGPYASPGVGVSRSFEIPPMTNAALAGIIKRQFGFVLDPRGMAQVIAYSAGAPGIAIATVSAALEQGLIRVNGEFGAMTGSSTWTDSLSTIGHTILAGIGEERRRTLEQLSVLGPVSMQDSVARLGEEPIAALADVDMVHMERTKDGTPIVSVKSALIDEFLRRQQGDLRFQLQSLGLGEDQSSRHPYPIPVISYESENALLSTTYVHYSRAVDAAAKQWKDKPNITNAIHYVETLWTTTADIEQIEHVFDESGSLPGMATNSAHWAALQFQYRTLIQGDLDTALERFEKDADTFPANAGIREVALVRARLFAGEDPRLDELPTNFEGLVPATEEAVTWTRFLAHVVRGEMADAQQLRSKLGSVEEMNAEEFATVGIFDIANGNAKEAAVRAGERFTRARNERAWQDLPQIMRVSGLAALFGYGTSRFWAQLVEYSSLGAPAPHVHAYQSVLSLWAAGSIWDAAALPVQFAPAKTTRIESYLPGAHPDWQRAFHLAVGGERDAAAELLTALADRQWGKGHRMAAACSYILAAWTDPRPTRIAPLDERVRVLGARGLDIITVLVMALCRSELDRAEECISTFEEGKLQPETRAHWLAVAHMWRQRGQAKRAEAAVRRAEDSLQSIERPANLVPQMPAEFNSREQELIHYLAAGLNYREIAEVLGVSVRSVEGTGQRAMKKVNVSSRADLLKRAGVG